MFRRKPKANELVSVCPAEGGIAAARVRQTGAGTPILTLCTFESHPTDVESHESLSHFVKTHDLAKYHCTSTMALGEYSLLLVEAPDVPPAELRAAMRWRVKDLLDYHVDDAVIDVFEVTDDDSARRNRMMYAVAARSAVVKQRVDALLDAGLGLRSIDIPELAMRNIAALLPEDAAGVAFIYLVGGGGIITVCRQGRLYLSRMIDTNRDIEMTGAPVDASDPQARPWLDRIVIELQRSMDYYESHFSQPPVNNLVVAPLANDVVGLEAYIGAQLGIEVRRLDLNTLIDSEEPVQEVLQHQCMFAIGAALRVEGKAL